MSHSGSAGESQHPASLRSLIIAGNWKMYKTVEEAQNFVETLAPKIKKSQARSHARVYLAVPYTAILPTVERVKALKAPITIGAQNMNDAQEGAFTGEVAARMIKEAGAQFVILGHSERRQYFHEDNAFIHRKLIRAIEEKIQPILCVGESLEERKKGTWEQVVRQQIDQCLENVAAEDVVRVVLAYEPVWAIGTGNTATAEDAQKAHVLCRTVIREGWGKEVAQQIVIQYGGSVKPEHVAEMISQEDIDGFLVGGGSLSPDTFFEIITGTVKARNKLLKKMESK